MIYTALLLGVMTCSAQDVKTSINSDGMTKPPESNRPLRDVSEGSSVSAASICCSTDTLMPLLSKLIQEQPDVTSWRSEIASGLSQLVQEPRKVASWQDEVLKVLQVMKDQGGQHLADLQNLARHHSLLVENNQALLLQVSRIVTQLQNKANK